MHPGWGHRLRQPVHHYKQKTTDCIPPAGAVPLVAHRPSPAGSAESRAVARLSHDGVQQRNHVRELYDLVRQKMIAHGGVIGKEDVQDVCDALGGSLF
jgi:hypothetical protein